MADTLPPPQPTIKDLPELEIVPTAPAREIENIPEVIPMTRSYIDELIKNTTKIKRERGKA